MSDKARAELCPTGVLRAGINLSNFLLVTGRSAAGDPEGVAPDMAAAIASALGVPVRYVPFKTPGELGDQAGSNVWDIGLIGAEPQQAERARAGESAVLAVLRRRDVVPREQGERDVGDLHLRFLRDHLAYTAGPRKSIGRLGQCRPVNSAYMPPR